MEITDFCFPKNDHESLSRILADVMSGKTILDPEKIRQTIVEKWSVEKNVRELYEIV